jgi:hypothetical protein
MVGISEFKYSGGSLNDSHSYLLPILNILHNTSSSVLENRYLSWAAVMDQWLTKFINSDSELLASILQPKASLWPSGNYPHLNLRIGSSYDDLKRQFGTFSYVMSLEIIAHVHDPRSFSRTCELLTDDGYAMISTPYHAISGIWPSLLLGALWNDCVEQPPKIVTDMIDSGQLHGTILLRIAAVPSTRLRKSNSSKRKAAMTKNTTMSRDLVPFGEPRLDHRFHETGLMHGIHLASEAL